MKAIAEEFSRGRSGGTLVIDVNWRPVFWEEYAPAEARRTIQAFLGEHAGGIVKITDEEVAWLFDGEIFAGGGAEGPDARVGEASECADRVGVGGGVWVELRVPVERRGVLFGRGAGAPGGQDCGYYRRRGRVLGRFSALHVEERGDWGWGLRADGELLRRGVEFATACGAATCMRPGAIGSQPTEAEALALLDRS